MDEVEIIVWTCSPGHPLPAWQAYRPPIRIEGFAPNAECRLFLKCGDYVAKGPYEIVMADAAGVVVIEHQEIVEKFLRTMRAFPVFVPATEYNDRFRLHSSATRRGIPCLRFLTGVAFMSSEDAMMAKLRMS